MKPLVFVVAVLMGTSVLSAGQSISNCTAIYMTRTGETKTCTVSGTWKINTAYPLPDTVTYLDECYNDAATPVKYFSQSSSITGTGGCMYYPDLNTQHNCLISVTHWVVKSTSSSVQNEMHLKGQDQGIAAGALGPTCFPQGTTEEDVKFCNVTVCGSCPQGTPKCFTNGTC